MTMPNTSMFRYRLHSGFTSGSSLSISGILRSRRTMVRRGQKPKFSISRSKKKRSVGCWIHILYSCKSGLSFLARGLFRAWVFVCFFSKSLTWVHFSLKLLELLGLLPCSVLPDLSLPTDSDGNTIDLNGPPSPSSLHEQIESSDSLRARNRQLAEHLERVQEEILNLEIENEEDPTRRRERVEHLNREVQELERQVEINKTRDAQRAHQISLLQEGLGEQDRKQGDQQSRLTLLNSWLRVLIHTRERRPR